jgi:putative holliday junction resolvase
MGQKYNEDLLVNNIKPMNISIKSEIIIAIDYGTKRVGIAVGNLITKTARPLKTIKMNYDIETELTAIYKEWNPRCFVLGYPLSKDVSSIHKRILKFKELIITLTSLDVYLVNEAYSSLAALDIIKSYKKSSKIKKEEIDAQSACIIAEQWMRDVKESN